MHQRKKRVSLTAGYSKTTSIPITSTLNTEWNILNPIIRTILYLRTCFRISQETGCHFSNILTRFTTGIRCGRRSRSRISWFAGKFRARVVNGVLSAFFADIWWFQLHYVITLIPFARSCSSGYIRIREIMEQAIISVKVKYFTGICHCLLFVCAGCRWCIR